MDSKLIPYLNDIESRIDEDQEELLLNSWKSFARNENEEAPFNPCRRDPAPPRIDWPSIYINDALRDTTLMVLSQFKTVSDILESGSDLLPYIRCNYGVGIIPTIFGAEVFLMEHSQNCLPNVRKLPDKSVFQKIIGSDFPKLTAGYGDRVLAVADIFLEIFDRYPLIAKYVRVDHPDCQGPFDLTELLYGSELFLDLYDDGPLIHALLKKLTDFYICYLDNWFSMFPPDGYHAYFGRLHKGTICIRDDSAMNISPEFYAEYVFTYDKRILEHFNGGMVHFCGRGDHYIGKMSEIRQLYAVDMSQPHYNKLDTIYKNTVDKGIPLYTYNPIVLEGEHDFRRISIR